MRKTHLHGPTPMVFIKIIRTFVLHFSVLFRSKLLKIKIIQNNHEKDFPTFATQTRQ